MNKKISETLWLHICEKCKYEWATKNENPIHCSNCNDNNWDEPYKKRKYE